MSAVAWTITITLLLFHQGSAELLEPDCGVPSDPVDGVTLSSSPWMAIIKTGLRKCTGVLIDQQYVITAASCLTNSTQALVRLGEFDRSQQNEHVHNFQYEEYYVETAIVHCMFYETDYLNDLALLKLKRKVTYKPHIRPICLLLNSDLKSRIDTIIEFKATLWGLNEITQYSNPKTDIISRLKSNECLDNLEVESSQICGSFNSGARCLELGSPLGQQFTYRGTRRYTLFGIQSYGISKTCVFTDIMSYVDWIVENMLNATIIDLKKPKIQEVSVK